MMRMVPDQRVNRTRANRAYARFARWLTIPPSLLLWAEARWWSRRGGSDGGRATPSDAPSAPELRLSRRLERSRGRKTRRWRYAPSRFDFSDAPPVLGERGGQRSCSSLVWLGGGSGRWRRLRCRRSRGGVQTTRVRRKGCPRRRRARGESGAYKACGARQAGQANFFPRCLLVQLEVQLELGFVQRGLAE